MSVFISYSHADSEFADKLATRLVGEKAHVWIDKWELNVGDSLIRRIEDAVDGAAAIVIVMSESSVASEWCRKELSAGLVRELAEKQTVVLPVLIDDSEIPLFLRDKMYADFRGSFEEGFKLLLQAVARYTNDTRSRIRTGDGHTDWSVEWGLDDDKVLFVLTFVQQARMSSHTCVMTIWAKGNDWATKRYHLYRDAGLEWVYRQVVLESLSDAAGEAGIRVQLTDAFSKRFDFGIKDPNHGLVWDAQGECRLLGDDTGFDVLLDVGGLLQGAVAHVRESVRMLTAEENVQLMRVLATIEK